MEEYKVFRKHNIKELFNEKEKSRKIHEKNKKDLETLLLVFKKNTHPSEEMKSELIGFVKEVQDVKKRMSKKDKPKILSFNLFGEQFKMESEDILEQMRYKVSESLYKEEKRLNSILILYHSHLNEVSRKVRGSVAFRGGFEPAIKFNEELEEFKKFEVEDYTKMGRLFDYLDSEKTKNFEDSFKKFLESLSNFNPSTSKDRIKQLAKENVAALVSSIDNGIKERTSYFLTLEGKVLAYATYEIESNQLDKTAETDEDINYLIDLQSKSDNLFPSIKDEPFEKINLTFNKLVEKEYLLKDEAIYVLACLKEKLGVDKSGETGEDLEDARAKALILHDNFGIKLESSFKIGRIIKDDDINQVYGRLSSTAGYETAHALIKTNPELFILDNGNLANYLSLLKETMECSKKYSEIADFNYEKNPAGFASFGALQDTRNKINNLEKSVLENTPKKVRVMISNKALERASKDSFILENKDKYLREIKTVAHSPLDRKKREKIGDFSVSPTGRSRKGFRVAWHYDGTSNTLFIDDLLYHTSQYGYIDSWNDRANKEINLDYYKDYGYKEFKGEI